MATDTQRLIAVSMGKIATSRTQRGGINLHKNLLVASVLHKARTAYMMENFQNMLANRRAQHAQAERQETGMDVSQSVSVNMDTSPNLAGASVPSVVREVTRAGIGSETNSELSKDNEPCDDKENTPPRSETNCSSENGQSQVHKTIIMAASTAEQCGKGEPLSPNTQRSGYVSSESCERCSKGCIKRRRSPVQEAEIILPKKPRMDSDLYDSEPKSQKDSVEQMQTDSPQISNLVTIFNTGFSGLCSTELARDGEVHNGDMTSKNIGSTLELEFSISRVRPCTLVVADKSMSCSTEVKDSRIESLSIPSVIALTV